MKHVGRHTIVRELASSEVLSTFEGTHADGRAVRLRVFGAVVELDDPAMTRFEEDLSQVAALRHLGIDKPIAWSAKRPVHVSTARVRGASLRDVCDDAPVGRIAVEVAAGVGVDVAEALHAAHSAGLVHAGLSADSILLGTDGRARVTDFGLMRCLNDLSFAQPQVMRGSIESLSPEQLSAPETVGPHTDVFGLGLALYRAMTGKPAFDAPSALGMSIRLSMGKPTPIDSHGVEIPDELREIVMKMLSATATARPPMELVGRTLAKLAGSWRDSVRSLAVSASPAEPEQDESERSAGSPTPPAPSSEATPEPVTPPGAPPRGEALSNVDIPPLPPSPRDSRASEPAPDPWPSIPPAGDGSEFETKTAPSFELATQPEIGLPESQSSDDYATVFELQSPPSHDDVDLPEDDVIGAPTGPGDTSIWPTTDDPGFTVSKTVILKAPVARPPRGAPRIEASAPPSLTPAPEDRRLPSETSARAAEWPMWTAVALGAFALLVGTAVLVILVRG
jgi:serine/threonine protein kinase